MNAGSSENKTPYCITILHVAIFLLTPFSPFSYLWGFLGEVFCYLSGKYYEVY